jgi:hypothetical protein
MASKFLKRLAALAAACGASIAGAPAGAAIYVGSWDPPSFIFPDLGWSGSALFTIPDACGTSGTLTLGNCPGMSAGPVTLTLFTLDDPSAKQTLHFTGTVPIFDATFSGGMLAAVDSGRFAPQLVTLPAAGGGGYSFTVQFQGAAAQLVSCSLATGQPWCGDAELPNSTDHAAMTFAPVPEPSTAALLLAGLLVGVPLARRRRRG